MKHPMHRTIIFSIFLVLLSAMPVSGATYYVKNGGNDGLDGLSDATAWATVAKVQNTAKSGDTVYFRSQDTWQSSGSPTVLTATAGVTYDGASYGTGTRAKFLATAAMSTPYYAVVQIYVSNVTFKGFDIDGGQHTSGGIYIGTNATTDMSNIAIDNCIVHDTGTPGVHAWSYGIHVCSYSTHTTKNVTITNTDVYRTSGEGIAVYPAWGNYGNKVDTVLIRNCKLYDNGTGAVGDGCGIAINNDSKNITVEYCYINNNSGHGINLRVSPDSEGPGNVLGAPNNVVVRYNVISNNLWYGVSMTNCRGFTQTGSFYNNIFYNNGPLNATGNGVDFFIAGGYNWANSVFNVYNNTFYNTINQNTNLRAAACFCSFGTNSVNPTINFKNNIVSFNYWAVRNECTSGLIHSNNLVYSTSGASQIHIYDNGKTYDRAGVLTWEPSAKNSDPLFAAAGSNFTLQAASPAIDAGVSVGLTKDFLANPIPIGAAPDIGAFEYQPYPSSTTTTPTTTVTGTTTTTTPTTTVTGTTTTTTPTTTVTGTTTTTTTTTTPTRVVKVKKRIFTR